MTDGQHPEAHARVAFQGEAGAFSEEAVLQHDPSNLPVACPTFDALFGSISEGKADYILAPIENTLAGTVSRVCDLLWTCDLTVRAEVIHPIRLCLIGCAGASLEDIRVVQSHPVALSQCENYFTAHPQIQRVAGEDTAGSLRDVVQAQDKSRAAIASCRAAALYGGSVLWQGLEDDSQNFTRFLILGPERKPATAGNKLTLLVHLAHQPGSLHRALGVFARRKMNLLKIESRPLAGSPWHYRFFLDMETPQREDFVQAALHEFSKEVDEVRLLGWYRAAAQPAGSRDGSSLPREHGAQR